MQYTTGTISINNGSTSVSGQGTYWLAHINTDYIMVINNEDTFYEVNQINADNLITLKTPYASTSKSNISYVLVRDYTKNFGWPTIKRGDLSWPTILSEALERIDRDFYNMPSTKAIKYVQFEPLATAPASGEGCIYYSSVSNSLQIRTDTGWEEVTLTPV
jgi:hypothetical protein